MLDTYEPLPAKTFFVGNVTAGAWSLLVPVDIAQRALIGLESPVALVAGDSNTPPTTATAATEGAFIQAAGSPQIGYILAGKSLFARATSSGQKEVSAACYGLSQAPLAPSLSLALADTTTIYINVVPVNPPAVPWRPALTQFRFRSSQASSASGEAPTPSGNWTTVAVPATATWQQDITGRTRNRESKIEVQLGNAAGFGESTILTARSKT